MIWSTSQLFINTHPFYTTPGHWLHVFMSAEENLSNDSDRKPLACAEFLDLEENADVKFITSLFHFSIQFCVFSYLR